MSAIRFYASSISHFGFDLVLKCRLLESEMENGFCPKVTELRCDRLCLWWKHL